MMDSGWHKGTLLQRTKPRALASGLVFILMLDDKLLANVLGPARYIGGEYNMVVKDPGQVDLRVAMCYPDLYEVGMCHVGLHILYNIVNARGDAYCERAFYPDADAVALLRQENLPLCALESHDALSCFDVVGITLQHELTYTTVLGMLELGGIPVCARDRSDADPIVIAGGPCVFNPEPVALFFDAIVIGDGEEAIGEVLDVVKRGKAHSRDTTLAELSTVEGVYVPSLHDPAQAHIRKRIVADLDAAQYPTRPIVPWAEVVHDRGQLEVARGCTRGCRFCQAGYVYRPVRERKPETLLAQAKEIIANSGYDEVSLVSLNCPDYTYIGELIDDLHTELSSKRVSVGLPSLRIDNFSVDLAQKVQRVRKSGLTFAPEAGSQRLRDAINKGVTEEDLFNTVEAAFRAGWQTIKLYFMIGLPTETDEDVLAIVDLVKGVAGIGREALGKRSPRMKLNVTVSSFIPKPATPMQWDGQISREEIARRQHLIKDGIRDRQVRVSFHDSRQSVVEAALARGSRQTGEAILNAYRSGAILDAWKETFQYDRWRAAFQEAGLDLTAEAEKAFDTAERLPWEHIDLGVDREYLLAERARVQTGELTPDCRLDQCHNCGMLAMSDCPLLREDDQI